MRKVLLYVLYTIFTLAIVAGIMTGAAFATVYLNNESCCDAYHACKDGQSWAGDCAGQSGPLNCVYYLHLYGGECTTQRLYGLLIYIGFLTLGIAFVICIASAVLNCAHWISKRRERRERQQQSRQRDTYTELA